MESGRSARSVTPRRCQAPEIRAALTELQDYLRTKTRLGIPCIPHEENITGLPVTGATTYPQMIGMACTWDPDLLRQNADATRRAMRWIGGRQALSPVLDVHDNAHWGRVEEAFGEEPYVTSMMGLAFIEGFRDRISARGSPPPLSISPVTGAIQRTWLISATRS